jgi:pSer/pThr/pTyr-binding forkhead associated (FHA) protein
LILECLGPQESEWNQQSFQVTKLGCVGGRKHNIEDSNNLRDIMLFKEITVSRRHFEITCNTDILHKQTQFYIRDLGSAGGTFIRIRHGTRKQLHPGMIVQLGKHQFTISSIDDMGDHSTVSTTANAGGLSRNVLVARKSVLNSEVISSIMQSAERIIADFSRSDDGVHDSTANNASNSQRNKDELSARLKCLTAELSQMALLDEEKDFKHSTNNNTDNNTNNKHDDALYLADNKTDEQITRSNSSSISRYQQRRCVLTCCCPDGSPLQGQSFVVGPEGASMGRKQSNAIALYMKVGRILLSVLYTKLSIVFVCM